MTDPFLPTIRNTTGSFPWLGRVGVILTLGLILLSGRSGAAEEWGEHLLIVANKSLPESVELARHYAERRSIATQRILALDCPQTMEISRQQFDETLRTPIEKALRDRGWLIRDASGQVTRNDCWLLVLCWGVPLKIASDPTLKERGSEFLSPLLQRNEAAVDSELAMLPVNHPMLTGPRNNLFYKKKSFSKESLQMILVARLDGPTVAVARSLVDRAMATETTGLLGRAYFDARGAQDPNLKVADDSLRGAAEAARQAGLETVLDEQESVFPVDYPMTEAALYAGWYMSDLSGAIARPGFHFRPGAVVYHIHSFSAATLSTGWVGPSLARGAAASVGNVYEPYLHLVLNSQIFFERLLAGHNFVESAYAATPAISWQQTVVGDPLYRPFPFSADEQLDRLSATAHPDLAWACLRKANLMMAAGKEPEAIVFLATRNKQLRNPILDEKLGDIYQQFKFPREAAAAYRRAVANYKDLYDLIRVSNQLTEALLKGNQPAEALAVLDEMVRKYPAYEGHVALLQRAARLAGQVGDNAKLEYYTKLVAPREPPPATVLEKK